MIIDGTPRPHLLRSLVNTDINYPEALSELVDNSLDSGADRVDIHIDKAGGKVVVSDNGCGVADFSSLITLGEHCKHETTKLGRYGVGFKNATIGLCKLVIVESKGRCARIDWESIQYSDDGKWRLDVGDASSPVTSGTKLTLTNLLRFAKLKSVATALAKNFSPALWAGRQIFICGERLTPWEKPQMQSRICVENTHPSGDFGYTLEAGIVEGNSDEPFLIIYEHRIIGGTSEPCGEYSTGGRFFGLITLFGEWPLLKHKDGVSDSAEAAWLYRSVKEDCEDLLKSCETMGELVETDEISSELSSVLGVIYGQPKRKPSNEEGTKKPKQTNRKVKRAERVAGEGDAAQKRSRRGFHVEYACLDPDRLYSVSVNSSRVSVILNSNHPFIARVREGGKEARPALHAVSLAAVVFSQVRCNDPAQLKMRFIEQTQEARFHEGLCKTLGSIGEKI